MTSLYMVIILKWNTTINEAVSASGALSKSWTFEEKELSSYDKYIMSHPNNFTQYDQLNFLNIPL